jgi:hypothetical protein
MDAYGAERARAWGMFGAGVGAVIMVLILWGRATLQERFAPAGHDKPILSLDEE